MLITLQTKAPRSSQHDHLVGDVLYHTELTVQWGLDNWLPYETLALVIVIDVTIFQFNIWLVSFIIPFIKSTLSMNLWLISLLWIFLYTSLSFTGPHIMPCIEVFDQYLWNEKNYPYLLPTAYLKQSYLYSNPNSFPFSFTCVIGKRTINLELQ